MTPAYVSSEGKALDRSPDDVAADGCKVEVRVTTGQTGRRSEGSDEVGADQGLARISIPQLSIRTIEAAGPGGTPVVGVTTAEAPGLDGIDARTSTEDAVSKTSETDALIRAAAAAVHEEARREQGLEVVLGRAVRVDRLQVNDVARPSRDVLDRQGALHSPAPLVFGVK